MGVRDSWRAWGAVAGAVAVVAVGVLAVVLLDLGARLYAMWQAVAR